MSTRFARVVIAQQQFHDDLCEEIPARKVVKLLQREHAAVVRKVKAMNKECNNPCTCCCDNLLAWLDERGR